MTGAWNNEIDQGGPAQKFNRCRVHHFGNFLAKCNKCGKIGHKDSDCRGKRVAASAHTQSIRACFECGDRNHFRDQCPKRNNQKEGNAMGRAYAIKDADKAQGPNVVTGMFLVNNRYASALFGLGSDMSFVNISFSHLIDINPVKLNTSYEIDLIPIELGSFDVIVGMDWLVKCDAVIARKYIERGCQLFLAQVTGKELTERHLEDVSVIKVKGLEAQEKDLR
ncbi:putative reverse transcriptase domain-containing protein [Tanacetum coccineum]